jgi:predicted transcriptional regulator
MTVTLTPDVETRLRSYAEEMDLDPEQISNAFLARDLEEAEAELQDTLAGLDRSVEDYNAGRWITAEEMSRQLKAHVAEIRATQQAKP